MLSEDLFELRDKPRFVWLVRASSAAPNILKQHREQAEGGVFLFGYFILDKQNKVPCLKAKRNFNVNYVCLMSVRFEPFFELPT